MKNAILSLAVLCTGAQLVSAQAVNDTVNTLPGYANNVWYSLENDDQGTSAANTWDIGLSTSMNAMDEMVTSAIFNHKVGTVYEIPESGSDIAGADTAGLSTWTPLYNSETTWTAGAFNNTESLGTFDYGWGTYNMSTHGIDANRVFVIRYANNTYKKLTISSANVAGTYTIVHSNLDNTGLVTETIAAAGYTTKNFVYYNLGTSTVVDREPVAANWDLYFHQYPSFDYDPPYTVTGIFQNHGVEIAKVYPVNNPAAYENTGAATYSEEINTIGYSWKAFGGMSFVVEDSTVYFIKAMDGDIWKVIMTGFGGSANGKYMFSKEKLETAAVGEAAQVFTSLYPNPAAGVATLVLNNAPNATVNVFNLMGELVYTQTADAQNLTTVQLNTAAFANGIYQVVTTTGATATAQKLIVQH